MVDCNQFNCHISQSCHPHRVCLGGGIKYPVKIIFKWKIKRTKSSCVTPAFTYADIKVTYQCRKKVMTERVWLTGQRCVNGCWDLERKSCSVIIKKSVWRVQMELSQ